MHVPAIQPSAPPPRVSVVVPCYNYGHYLPACVASILEQPAVDVEVIIVDDASPDGSAQVAQALATESPRIRVIEHKVNRGHIASYNHGLGEAGGEFVVLLSADDMLTPGALSRATDLMQSHPSVGLVYGCPVVIHGDQPPPPVRTRVRNWTVWRGEDWIRRQCRRGLSIIYSPEAVVRTSVQRRVGGYDPALPHSADLAMWLKIAAVSNIGRVNGADQAFRRMHPTSMMATRYGSLLVDLEHRLAAFERFFDGPGRELPRRDTMRSSMERRLAQEALEAACGGLDDGAGDDGIAALARFAHDTCPDAPSTWQWRDYQLRRRLVESTTHTPGSLRPPLNRLRAQAFDARRDLEARLRWRRWRWSGT